MEKEVERVRGQPISPPLEAFDVQPNVELSLFQRMSSAAAGGILTSLLMTPLVNFCVLASFFSVPNILASFARMLSKCACRHNDLPPITPVQVQKTTAIILKYLRFFSIFYF